VKVLTDPNTSDNAIARAPAMSSRGFALLAFAASSLAATQCSNFVPPASKTAEPVVVNATSTWVYAQTSDCPTSCGAHCEAGCLFCADSGILPGMLPPADTPNTQFIAVSTSAKTDQCAAAFDGAGAYKYASGDLIAINGTGLIACYNKFYRASHTCKGSAACGTWTKVSNATQA
jgi:hypothetical protein